MTVSLGHLVYPAVFSACLSSLPQGQLLCLLLPTGLDCLGCTVCQTLGSPLFPISTAALDFPERGPGCVTLIYLPECTSCDFPPRLPGSSQMA